MSTGPLLALSLDPRQPLGRQLEQRLRDLIRSGGLAAGAELPSTRALAVDLGISRGVVVGAYAQLAAEGYLTVQRGTAPTVAAVPHAVASAPVEPDVAVAGWRFNLRADLPDLALFPRSEWLASTRAALRRAPNTHLAYGEPFGAAELRHRLVPFLARTRGVVAVPARVGVHAGSTQALAAILDVLRERGARRIAVEDPGHRWRTAVLRASGLELVPVPVDEAGLRVDLLGDADAIVVSPDHHFPLGVTLAPERRRALVEWAIARDAFVLEHDYDAHFRYDRAPAAALQALAPEHVVYIGTASALLAPTLRLGWSVLPAELVEHVAGRMATMVFALPRLDQLALADFVARGYLDRHLRRARAAYKRRRQLVRGTGAPAGLFVHVPVDDEQAVLERARAHGVWLDGVNEHCLTPQPPGVVVGFAAESEPALRRALRLVA